MKFFLVSSAIAFLLAIGCLLTIVHYAFKAAPPKDPIDLVRDFKKVACLAKPPNKIAVGPYTYTVYCISRRDAYSMGLHAAADFDDFEIYLTADDSLGAMQENLLHELMHAAIDVGKPHSAHLLDEDGWIESTAPVLTLVLRDNPDLVKWLQKR